MKEHRISFLKGNIQAYSSGRGKCVVLLHGFLGSSEIFKEIVPHLQKSCKVVLIDLPGHGKSECLGYAHSMELMADAVHAVLKKLRIKKCVMAGHSMGGYVTLAFTQKYPEYIKGMCLINSTALPDTEEKKKDRNRAIHIVRKNPKLFIRPMIKNLFSVRNSKYLKNEIHYATNIALQTPVQGIIAALIGMRDRPSYLSTFTHPLLPAMMVIGKYDKVLPEETLFKQCENKPNKTYLYLPYDGHFTILENPLAVAKALRKFSHLCFRDKRSDADL